MAANLYRILCCAVLVLACTACAGGHPVLTGGSPGAAGPGSMVPQSPRVPGLPTVARLGSVDPGQKFLIRQDGADFAADVAANRCAVNGTMADFTPDWSATAANGAGSAAFAIYRLTYNPQNTPVTLALAWNGNAPADSDCWVGLSDWTGQLWRWQQPVAGQVELANPTQFVDGSKHCCVALLVLGQTPVSLGTIGFGTPPPPPTNGDGYTLFCPLNGKDSYLIDMDGNVVHQWTSAYTPGASGELLENGHLLRTANLGNTNFGAGGRGGRIEEYDWDGNLVWFYELNTATQCTHHDFKYLPNGHILLLTTNVVDHNELINDGRDPAAIGTGNFWVDSLVEIEPTLPSGGNVVWQWRVLDHLTQDFNAAKANYSDPAAHPELIDINYPLGATPGDWIHCNALDYNPDLDQIMITALVFNEIWVIDHSTTMAEAAGHTGGHLGHGGDLLYRWGNPEAYRAGTVADKKLFGVHNGHWIADDLDGAGDILVFQNKVGTDTYSAVSQLTPPVNPDGSYNLTGAAYGPADFNWVYTATPPNSFSSPIMGGAQRLPGGETLIDSATQGHFFVVDSTGAVKWEYMNTYPTGQSPVVFRALRYLPDYPGVANLQTP